ncbi:MAG: nitronate monooxygenase, partial [Firmicutes bacterium]|nr:nitronate monooxygenase [Bacillota bacterium]
LRMVYQVAKAVRVPVIGMGGVSCARDVIEMMMAGASAVEVGAANLVDPFACKRIIEDLPRVMDELRIEKLTDIIGIA